MARLRQILHDIFVPKKVGMDLGTANSLVYVEGKGVVVKEPTVVAIDAKDMQIIAVGDEAKYMLGKNPERIIMKRPMRGGVIASAKITSRLLSYFLRKALGPIRFFKPEVVVSTPYGITSVEQRAVLKATLEAGARRVYLIPEPLAAALGAGLPIHESLGNMIINLGGGTAEIAVISLNGIVVADSLRVAGDEFNNAIMQYARHSKGIIIGEQMAERIKIQIGSSMYMQEPLEMEVSGRDVGSGLPRTVMFTSNEVVDALEGPLSEIIAAIKKVLEKTPPELAADIKELGITLSGGSALLRHFDQLLMQALQVPVYLAEDPLHCVVKGTAMALDYLDILEKNLTVG